MPSLRTPLAVLAVVPVVALAALAGLQVVNHRRVHETLCSANGVTCTPGVGWLAIEARIDPAVLPPGLLAQPLQVQARTALVRNDCDEQWQMAFGARIEIGPLDLGKHFKSQGACVDVFRQAVRGRLLQAQLSCQGRDVAARLDPATLHWGEDLAVKVQAEVAADAQATCVALWREPPGDGPGGLPAVQRLALDLRWGLAFEEAGKLFAPLAAPAAQDPGAGGWLRRGLALMSTAQDLQVTLPDGRVTLRFASAPGQGPPPASPELTLTLGAEGSALKWLPEEIKGSVTAARPLSLRWNLDHETGRVFVNNRPIERQVERPRPPGPNTIGADECQGPAPTTALHFVEAADNGEAVDPAQLQTLLRALDEANAGPGAIVSVFVHGWQHSAARGDSYVCDFARLMTSVEMMETQAARSSGRQARKVLGVYVGWPGNPYGLDIANGTTFWNRLQAADRLGAEGSVLGRLIPGLAQRVAARASDVRADRRSVLIVTGHSMGARAVFHAVRHGLMQPPPASAAAAAGAARHPDLVLLVNPAFSADLYRDIHEQEAQCRPIGVRLLSFSSKADRVTREIYPAGQTVTFDRGAPKAAPFPEHIYTAANFGEFVTHRLRLTPLQGEPPRPDGEQSILRGFQRVPAGSGELYRDNPVTVFRQPASGTPRVGDAWYRMQLERLGTKAGHCPDSLSKVIEVDARIVPDHGTIFTPAFMEYVVRTLNRAALAG